MFQSAQNHLSDQSVLKGRIAYLLSTFRDEWSATQSGGANFSRLLMLMTFVEVLNEHLPRRLAKRSQTKRKTKRRRSDGELRFTRQYLGRVNSSYRNFAGLLCVMWRHKLAHEFSPKGFALRDGRRIGWQFSDDSGSRVQHLQILQDYGGFVFHVNLNQFFDDIQAGISRFQDDVLAKSLRTKRRYRKQFDMLEKEPTEKELLEKYRYLSQGEFRRVRQQVKRCGESKYQVSENDRS